VEREQKEQRGWAKLTPEEKLLRAIFGENAETSRVVPEGAEDDFAGDQALLNALDAISDSLEANVGRWNSALDLIEEDLSRSMAARRNVEAAAL
jgi:hypothetical protein